MSNEPFRPFTDEELRASTFGQICERLLAGQVDVFDFDVLVRASGNPSETAGLIMVCLGDKAVQIIRAAVNQTLTGAGWEKGRAVVDEMSKTDRLIQVGLGIGDHPMHAAALLMAAAIRLGRQVGLTVDDLVRSMREVATPPTPTGTAGAPS